MDGVGHGTELAGRYRLEERLRTTASSDFWRAVDTTLDRTVGVRLVAPAAAESAMDAARRAAVVDAPALLRVLDVAQEAGDTGPVTYVVTEFVEADSLADLLQRHGPLPADQVRSLVGQTAQVLAAAAEAGLHHEALEPTSVLRTPSGEVKLQGLGVDAAAEGRAGAPGDQAARADAVALVALVYAGLTGHWPLDGEVAGLEPAPRIGGVPVPPADIVDDVPNDLDTLCAVTLGPVDDGPLSPAEVVENLRPWASGATAVSAARAPAAGPGGGDAPTQAIDFSTAGDAGGGPDRTRPEPAPRAAMRPAGRFPRSGAAGAAAAGGAAVAPGAPDPEQEQTAAVPRSELFGGDDPSDAQDRPVRSGVAPAAAAAAPAGDPRGPEDGRADGYDDGYDDAYDEEYGYDDDDEDLGEDDAARPDRRPMIALAVLAVLVVIGLVLALQAIGGLGGDGDDVATDPTSSAAGASSSAPPSSDAAPAGPVPEISGVRTLDPQGGDGENDETAPRAIDDDPDSFWRSSTYTSAEFGGLKDGLGMVVTLSQETAVSGVTLQVNGSGGVLEVRTAPGQGLEDSEVVATATPGSGTVTVELDEPVSTANLVLWWTELPTADGSFRIELADVAVQ